MQRNFRDMLVGLTVIVGLAGVAALLVLFGELSLGKPPSYRIALQLNQVSGLTTASRVSLNGVVVGSISSIVVSPNPRDGAIVTLQIQEPVRIPRDAEIVLERGLVGEATLLFRTIPGPIGEETDYIGSDETLSAIALSVVDDIVNALDQRLGKLTEAAGAFTRLADTYIEVGRRASDLLTPRTTVEVDAGAPSTLPSALARIDGAVADARLWLGDETLRTDAQSITARIRTLLDSSASAIEDWTVAANTISTRADQVGSDVSIALRDIAATTRALQETLAHAQEITAKINRGEGTMGLLVNNPDLYRSLNDAAIRLEKSLVEAQLLIEKYRKEGVPIQF